LYRNLIRHEAKLGGSVFGPGTPGHRREFFCLDEHTWVWHDEWTDQTGQPRTQTTRYDVRPSGIMKAQGAVYQPVSHEEAMRLHTAAKMYRDKVKREMYSFAA
jgi:hypothetical protein